MIGRFGLGRVLSRSLSSTEAAQKLTIQPAIERSPTDLLAALSETVGPDTTAPHFAYIDDPITIPSTQSAKKTYFMAKEFGKRAARELAAEWPTLFAFDRDQPQLPAFRPQHLADPLQVEPTEKSLLAMIASREVQDCCVLYERMRSENVEVSEAVQLELFRLVTYYNSSNIPFSEWETFSGMRNYGENEQSAWKSGAVADLLFETLPRTDETVSIMIAGLCKFSDHASLERARNLYKEHKGKIHLEAFNGLIGSSSYSVARKLVVEIEARKIAPSVDTFNALLTAASKIPKFEERVKAFTEVIGEMKTLNQEAPLSSYHLIVKNLIDGKLLDKEQQEDGAYTRQLTLGVSWLNEILETIEGKPLEPVTSTCHLFFVEAMGLLYRASNEKLAKTLLSIYESPTNQVKMPAFTIESMFYNRYLQLAVEQTTSLPRIHDLYTSMVPRLVGVNNALSALLYRKLSASDRHWPLLRRVIIDGITSGQINGILGEEMRKQLCNVELHTLNPTEREQFTALVQKLVAVWIEYSKFTEERMRRLQRKLSPSQISECALLLTRIGETQKAYELLELLLDEEAAQGEEATVLPRGFARPWAMAELFEDALRKRDTYGAATCLQVMALTSTRAKLEPLANRIMEKCNVNAEQERIINGFVRLRPQ
uniref:Protein PTCD3 homolog, mitochondrial n=1 Tax=Caenorhabditis tropicalis TaxID=1561998 RepID=A0A1I7UVC7_9PELO